MRNEDTDYRPSTAQTLKNLAQDLVSLIVIGAFITGAAFALPGIKAFLH